MDQEKETVSALLESAEALVSSNPSLTESDIQAIHEGYAKVILRLGMYAAVLDVAGEVVNRKLETFREKGEVNQDNVIEFFKLIKSSQCMTDLTYPDAKEFAKELAIRESSRHLKAAGVDIEDTKAILDFYQQQVLNRIGSALPPAVSPINN